MEILDSILIKDKDKFKRGLSNELAISGNLSQKGIQTKVLNDKNPNYDIEICKDGSTNYIECKLDALADKTNNFYFEVFNYTYNRPCGICNTDTNTLYCHTFKLNGEWHYIINYRKAFIKVLKMMLSNYPDRIRQYNHTYFINGKLVGDKAYLVDIATFLQLYNGKQYTLNAAFKW